MKHIYLTFTPPYNIGFSSSPLDNQTFRTIATFGTDKCLRFDLHTYPHFGLPQINDCKSSTPPRWQSELHSTYVTSFNNEPLTTKQQFKDKVKEARMSNATEVVVRFATIERLSMHPEKGIPQLYQDQLNIIGDHLWELRYNPEWQSKIEEALPCLEVMQKDTYVELSIDNKAALHKALQASSIKKQQKLTQRLLQQRPDWHDWIELEFKQLDQYHDQDTFGEPEP